MEAEAGCAARTLLLPAAGRTDMVYDNARQTLYITSGGNVLRYQPFSNSFESPLALGGSLEGIDLLPNGNTLAIADSANSGGQSHFDLYNLATNSLSTVSFPDASGESGTYMVQYGSDGTLLTTSNFAGSGWIPLRKYDPVSGMLTTVASVRQNSRLTASSDRHTIAVVEANISSGPLSKYSVDTGILTSGTTTGWFTFEVAVSKDAAQYAVPTYDGTYIYDQNFHQVALLGQYASDGPIGAVYSPSGDALYVAWWSYSGDSTQIRKYSTSTFQLLDTYETGQTFPWIGNDALSSGRMKISADGDLLFATAGNGVVMVELPEPATLTVLAAGCALLLLRRARAARSPGREGLMIMIRLSMRPARRTMAPCNQPGRPRLHTSRMTFACQCQPFRGRRPCRCSSFSMSRVVPPAARRLLMTSTARCSCGSSSRFTPSSARREP